MDFPLQVSIPQCFQYIEGILIAYFDRATMSFLFGSVFQFLKVA